MPGGCFYASVSAELDTHPGPVCDRVAEHESEWFALLTRYAHEEGADDPAQLAFDVNAALRLANNMFVLHGDRTVIDRARHSVHHRVRDAIPT